MDEVLESKKKILLVGEGNFSFSLTLKSKLLSDTEMVTTCYEGDSNLGGMDSALENMSALKRLGARVMTNVDASQLHLNPLLSKGYFDCVIFQFPHVGGKGNIKKNRSLLKGFFISASEVISIDGAVLVTLCNGQGGTPADFPKREWCNSWQVVAMATYGSLILTETVPFDPGTSAVYQSTGYRSQDKSFNTSSAVVHIFHKDASLPACPSQRRETLSKILNIQRVTYNTVCSELLDAVLRSLNTTAGLLVDVDRAMTNESKTSQTIHPKCTNIEDEDKKAKLAPLSHTNSPLQTPNSVCPHSLISFACSEHNEDLHCCVKSCMTSIGNQTVLFSCIKLVRRRHPISPHWSPIMHYAIMVSPCDNIIDDRGDGRGLPQSMDDFRTKIVQAVQRVISNQPINNTATEIVSDYGGRCTMCDTTYAVNTCILNFRIPISMSFIQREKSVMVGLCLEQLVLNKVGLDDVRLLWSCDLRWWSRLFQLAMPTVPYSMYPPVYVHDLSFWESPEREFDEREFLEVVRKTAGDSLCEVGVIGDFELNGRKSQCYRMTYQSCDQALTRDQAWASQEGVREGIKITLDLTLR